MAGLGLLTLVGQGLPLSGCGSSLGGDGAKGGAPGSGGAGAQGGGGGVTMVGPAPRPPHWQQVICSVQRTECSGFVEDDSTGLDGLDVSCPTGNLVQNVSFNASICYETGLGDGGALEQQQADAQNACNRYCADGWLGLYPLGVIANKPNADGGMVTCSSTAQNDAIADEVAGQCSETKPGPGGAPGATTFALCLLYGRQCNAQQTAKDGTQYCTSMPPVNGGQSTSGCFDSTTTTAELFCQNNFRFPLLPPGAANQSDEFHYWRVAQVEPEDTEADCQIQANNVGFAVSRISRVERVVH
jgi:hypothetical protein